MESSNVITVETTVNATLDKVWKLWTEAEHIMQWNNASEDWHTPSAENDPRTDGKFKSTMAAKDGSFSFDFEGVYSNVIPHEFITYEMADGRKVQITFTPLSESTGIAESFEPETENSHELQRTGWQAILDNFKKYTENFG